MRPCPWMAHLLSGVRLLLAPVVLLCASHRAWGPACGLFAAACLTDLLDGPLARAAGGGGLTGVVFDLAADLLLVFPLSIWMAGRRMLPAFIPGLMAASFLSYCTACAAKRSPARHRLGGCAGAVSAAGLGAAFFMKLIDRAFPPAVWWGLAAYLAATAVENLAHLGLDRIHFSTSSTTVSHSSGSSAPGKEMKASSGYSAAFQGRPTAISDPSARRRA